MARERASAANSRSCWSRSAAQIAAKSAGWPRHHRQQFNRCGRQSFESRRGSTRPAATRRTIEKWHAVTDVAKQCQIVEQALLQIFVDERRLESVELEDDDAANSARPAATPILKPPPEPVHRRVLLRRERWSPAATPVPRILSPVPSTSTPHRARTCNLRFRRPMLYPIELGVLRNH